MDITEFPQTIGERYNDLRANYKTRVVVEYKAGVDTTLRRSVVLPIPNNSIGKYQSCIISIDRCIMNCLDADLATIDTPYFIINSSLPQSNKLGVVSSDASTTYTGNIGVAGGNIQELTTLPNYAVKSDGAIETYFWGLIENQFDRRKSEILSNTNPMGNRLGLAITTAEGGKLTKENGNDLVNSVFLDIMLDIQFINPVSTELIPIQLKN